MPVQFDMIDSVAFNCFHCCAAAAAAQIGVLGWLTPDTAVTSLSIGKTKFLPITASVTACLKELKKQHPDVNYIIGLSHGGEMIYNCNRQAYPPCLPY
jgi:hypothetical protein